jgi:hypothetical protein
VNILSLTANYDLREDGFSLSESSQKLYLEDLLLHVRRRMELSKGPSPAKVTQPPVRTSTPNPTQSPSQGLSASQSVDIDEDVRYM